MSDFTQYDLGRQPQGARFRVDLSGSAANVLLLDSSNFSSYQRQAQFSYQGGLYERSPVFLETSHAGHWYIVVDMNGLVGTVHSSVQSL